MKDQYKQYIAAFLTLATVYALVTVAGSYKKSVEQELYRSFSVSGQGEVTVIPDIAQFTFSVVTQGGLDLQTLQNQNTENSNNAISFVKNQGVEDKDIKTTYYNIQPRYQYFSCRGDGTICPPAEIIGYEVTQTTQVKVRDFGKLGEMLAGIVQQGANTVSQVSFTLDQQDQAEQQAREQAIQKAKEKARSTASAGEFSLGKLLSIQENAVYPVSYDRYSEIGIGGATPAPTLEPGSQKVTATVVLEYEIR